MKQLVERAGPGLREGFRHNDEHIKVRSHLTLVMFTISFWQNAADWAGQERKYAGSAALTEVRALSAGLLAALWEEGGLGRDRAGAGHQPATPTLTGMGSSGLGGRLEGFGSNPVVGGGVAVGVADKVREFIEGGSDPKQELRQLCLQDSRAGYTPLVVPGLEAVPHPGPPRPHLTSNRRHTPGRAGGGWSSDSEEEKQEADAEENTEEIECETEQDKALAEYCSVAGGPGLWAATDCLVTSLLDQPGPGLQALTRLLQVTLLQCCSDT